ncbi:hypothetical protein KIL84_004797, partial [Mauremys mutica]
TYFVPILGDRLVEDASQRCRHRSPLLPGPWGSAAELPAALPARQPAGARRVLQRHPPGTRRGGEEVSAACCRGGAVGAGREPPHRYPTRPDQTRGTLGTTGTGPACWMLPGSRSRPSYDDGEGSLILPWLHSELRSARLCHSLPHSTGSQAGVSTVHSDWT